jgi:hypothetical protein
MMIGTDRVKVEKWAVLSGPKSPRLDPVPGAMLLFTL